MERHAAKVCTPWAGELVTEPLRRLKHRGICGHSVGSVFRSLHGRKSRNPQLQIMRKILLGVHPTGIPQGNTQSCPCSVNVKAKDLTSCGHGSNVIEWQYPSSGCRCSISYIQDTCLNFITVNDAYFASPKK